MFFDAGAARELRACLSLLIAVPAAAAALPRLDATPAQLLLGRDPSSALVLSGAPEDREARAVCSSGEIKGWARTGPQSWSGQYVPRGKEAGWVLCAAIVPGNAAVFATAVIELERRDTLALRDLPPLSRVEVSVGDSLFAPVRANGDGFAEVPVLLSPRLDQAKIVVTPPGQEPSTRLQPLGEGPTEQILLYAMEPSLAADGEHATAVWAFTLTAQGAVADLPVAFSASEGELSMHHLAPGTWLGSYSPVSRGVDGDALLSAKARGRTAAVRLKLTGACHPRIAWRLSRQALPADGMAAIDVSLRVTDERGRGMEHQPLRLWADRGAVGAPEELGGGVYLASFRAPSGPAGAVRIAVAVPGAEPVFVPVTLTQAPRLVLSASTEETLADGKSSVWIRLTARDADDQPLPDGTPIQLTASLGSVPERVTLTGGAANFDLVAGTVAGRAGVVARSPVASAQLEVAFRPGPVSSLAVVPELPSLPCDGLHSEELRVFARDAFGNPVDQARIVLAEERSGTSGGGSVSETAAQGLGAYSAVYRSPPSCDEGTIALEATSGDQTARASLQLTRPPRLGLSAAVGAEQLTANGPAASVELGADLHARWMPPTLAAAAGVELLAAVGVKGPSTAVLLTLGPQWRFLNRGRWSAFAGAGGNLEVGAGAPVGVGVHARVGTFYALGPGQLIAQARWVVATAEGGPGLSAGYRVAF